MSNLMKGHKSMGHVAASFAKPRVAPRRGTPLPDEIRRDAEELFGEDFSDVRVIVSDAAPKIGAIAFTTGSEIHIAPGVYRPGTEATRALLGHELAHVVQQRRGRATNPHGYGVAVVRDMGLEAEADRMGRALQMMQKGEVMVIGKVLWGQPYDYEDASGKGFAVDYCYSKKKSDIFKMVVILHMHDQDKGSFLTKHVAVSDKKSDDIHKIRQDLAKIVDSGGGGVKDAYALGQAKAVKVSSVLLEFDSNVQRRIANALLMCVAGPEGRYEVAVEFHAAIVEHVDATRAKNYYKVMVIGGVEVVPGELYIVDHVSRVEGEAYDQYLGDTKQEADEDNREQQQQRQTSNRKGGKR